MSLRTFLRANFPLALSRLMMMNGSRTWAKKRRSDGNVNYGEKIVDSTSDLMINDAPAAFYLRAILENAHRTAIEIGSFNGARIKTVKRCLPDIKAIGLDIGARYQSPFQEDGVDFEKFDLDVFRRQHDKPVVLAHCTMNYMPPDILSGFIDCLAQARMPIAFSEPVPVFRYDETLIRSKIAYYHPYRILFSRAGFDLAIPGDDDARFHSLSISMGEFKYTNYAVPR